jgi:Secretion system C-terminal sorting domain
MFGNSGIVQWNLNFNNDTISHLWLYKNGVIDTLSVTYKSFASNIGPINKPVLKATVGYLFDHTTIYRTDFTAANTSIIFNSNLLDKTAQYPILLEENNDIIYWVDNGAPVGLNGFNNRRQYLYKMQNNVTTLIDTTNEQYDEFRFLRNNLTNDVVVFKKIFNNSTNELIYFTANGNFNKYAIPEFYPLAFVNNKLIGCKTQGFNVEELIKLDYTTGIVSDLKPYAYRTMQWPYSAVSNGKHCYLVATTNFNGNKAFYTNGDTICSASNLEYTISSDWIKKGRFCGDDYYNINEHSNTVAQYESLEKFTPLDTNTTIKILNDSMDRFTAIEIADNNIFYGGHLSSNPFAYHSFYKIPCGMYTSLEDAYKTPNQFSVYPNPAKDNIVLDVYLKNIKANMVLLDVTGRIVKSFVIHNGINYLQIASVPNGIYQIKIDGYRSQKIVVE